MADLKKEDISDAIFDALSLYCVQNKYYDSIKNLTREKLKPIQDEVEKLLTSFNLDIE